MRKLLGFLFVVSALLLGSAQVEANALNYTGALSISLATLAPATITGTGVATTTGGFHANTVGIAANVFSTVAKLVPVTDPAAAPIGGLQLTVANNAGNFVGGTGAGPIHGVMGLAGFAKVCLFAACNGSVVTTAQTHTTGSNTATITGQPPHTVFPPSNLQIPLIPVGAGGFRAVSTLVQITAIGAPWTAGTAAVGTVTVQGFQHGPASISSTLASGNIRLVTPVFVSTNISASAVVPVFGVLDLHFVPEPGTLLLLGSGIAGLVMLGRSRRS